jgi:haloacid dehalogenase-like hydrolase
MRRVIDAHHANGDKTYLVTAAPRELAERIAAYLGMDGALGTEAELVDGVYTGRLVGPVLHGPAKLDAVRQLAGEQRIDLSQSSAYSDSLNDLPLLEGVGHPVAVNPDRMLRELAAERGWPVQDFRRRRRLWLVWLPSGVGAAGAAVLATAGTPGQRLGDRLHQLADPPGAVDHPGDRAVQPARPASRPPVPAPARPATPAPHQTGSGCRPPPRSSRSGPRGWQTGPPGMPCRSPRG